jgi:hypothetical protein
MSELGNQPQPYRPPAQHPDGTKRCAVCHTPLLMAPLGASAGLCPNLACIQIGELTAQRLRDFNLVAQMILLGKMTATLEEETLIMWLSPTPPPTPRVGLKDPAGITAWFTPEQAAEAMERSAGVTISDGPEAGYTVIRKGE